MALFGKSKKQEKKTAAKGEPRQGRETPKEFGEVGMEKTGELPVSATSTVLPGEYGVLKGFYVSEKASGLISSNQYVFKVFKDTTKNEIRKQVEKSFSVKVKGIKIVNLPRKSRTVGRHKGFKQGVKKAIVVLEKGYSIEQAKT